MAKPFDEEIYKRYEITVYNALEIAEGTSEPIAAGVYDELPPLDKIGEAVKNKGFDSFEVSEITEHVKRYTVE